MNDRKHERVAMTPDPRSDEALLGLVRAAAELDEFEAAAGEGANAARESMPRLRLVGASGAMPARRVEIARKFHAGTAWRWVAAAAALVAIGVMIWGPGGGAGRHVSPGPVSIDPGAATRGVTPKDEGTPVHPPRVADGGSSDVADLVPVAHKESIVLTIFQGAGRTCRRVSVASLALAPGRTVHDLSPTELQALALRASNAQEGDEVIVLGMSGPGESLPRTAQLADEFVTSCLDYGTESCRTEGSCFAARALECVPSGVSVVGERLAMGR